MPKERRGMGQDGTSLIQTLGFLVLKPVLVFLSLASWHPSWVPGQEGYRGFGDSEDREVRVKPGPLEALKA